MSRIFDAVQRMVEERHDNGERSVGATFDVPHNMGLIQTQTNRLEDLNTVKTIDYRPSPELRLAVRENIYIPCAESFRLLRYRFGLMRQKRPLRVVLVSSSIPKEGKTMVALNLAASFGQVSDQVLLVDADLRKQGAKGPLGLGGLPGLSDLLENRITLCDALHRIESPRLYFLAAGKAKSNPFEFFQSSAMQELLARLKSTFEWIVLDAPPLVPFADSQCLASLSDAVLMVVREAFTPREEFQRAIASLGDVPISGIVVNRSTASRDDYYYSYYRRPEAPRGVRRVKTILRRREGVRAKSNGQTV